MGFIGDLLGGGGKGSNFQAQQANIATPTTNAQAGTAYDQTQQGLAQQQAFLQAIQGQNGLQNQSNVYNQLQGVANGTGPNPAMAALNNATGQNVANQAALMAGQRGAGSNVGLIARQAAMQGANTQQQAVGQGAALQANQSLNAIGQAGNIANQQVANQATANSAYNQYAQGQQNNLLNSINAQNTASVANMSQANSANGAIAAQNAKSQNGLLGGLLGGAATALTGGLGGLVGGGSFLNGALGSLGVNMGGGADGFTMPTLGSSAGGDSSSTSSFGGLGGNYSFRAHGGEIHAPKGISDRPGPRSKIGVHMNGGVPTGGDVNGALMPPQPTMLSTGGNVPAMVSPGEKVISHEEAQKVASKETSIKQAGQTVPGKAPVSGDSKKNDIVPASLSAGDFVIPKTIMEGKDPERGAAAFVRAHMSRSQSLKKDKK